MKIPLNHLFQIIALKHKGPSIVFQKSAQPTRKYFRNTINNLDFLVSFY